MSVLNKIAWYQHRRDEAPNQQLAEELAQSRNKESIRELGDNLWNANAQVQSDCLKVLYEIGFLAPELVAPYTSDFLKLLQSKNNRLVWGSMIALATVAEIQVKAIAPHWRDIALTMEQGSVITKDNGVKTLALLAAADARRRKPIFAYLLNHLRTCRPKDVPQHAEKTVPAVTGSNKAEFAQVLEQRMSELSTSQLARVRKIIAQL